MSILIPELAEMEQWRDAGLREKPRALKQITMLELITGRTKLV